MIVLDCSAGVAIARDTEEGRAFRALLLRGEKIIAPNLFRVESGSVVGKYVRARELNSSDIERAYSLGVSLVDEFFPDEPLMVEAISESIRYKHSVYDMLYIALARRQGAVLFTLDQRMQDVCLNMGVNCVETSVLT